MIGGILAWHHQITYPMIGQVCISKWLYNKRYLYFRDVYSKIYNFFLDEFLIILYNDLRVGSPMAETRDLKSLKWGFESPPAYCVSAIPCLHKFTSEAVLRQFDPKTAHLTV